MNKQRREESGMVMSDFWRGRQVLVTGHTGFKGGWLALWLTQMGAEVHGIALAPDTTPALFDVIGLEEAVASSTLLDIRETGKFSEYVRRVAPQTVFHLAAQPLVRRSYEAPLETFTTNTMGTANLLDACRHVPNLEAVLVITTDKVYENREWDWPYRETDTLGGKDPYSASKAACEIVVASFRKSFLEQLGVAVATARGGNVIGGGDWSKDRILPDVFRAALSGATLEIRSPSSVRPWQHVLVLCHGYLQLAQAMVTGKDLPNSWNFGPQPSDCVSVSVLLDKLAELDIAPMVNFEPSSDKRETKVLALDSSQARTRLGWQPALDLHEALRWTAEWYLAEHRGEDMHAFTKRQITDYSRRLE